MDLGLRQREVAEQLGVPLNRLGHWERDLERPEPPGIAKVIGFLGYDPLPVGENLGSRVRALRRRLGLTQPELGRRLGVDDSTVRGWEANEHPPNLQNSVALAAAFRAVGIQVEPVTSEPATFPDRLRASRWARGWDQLEVARRVGVSREAVIEWEAGRTWPQRRQATRLTDIFGDLGVSTQPIRRRSRRAGPRPPRR